MILLPDPILTMEGGGRYNWTIELKQSAASCDTCGDPGVKIYENTSK
jgi:hypothetical protein